MVLFARLGMPVIHMGTPQPIARAYGLPVAPDYLPVVGAGDALGKEGYSLTIVAAMLIAYLALTFGLTLPQMRQRLMAAGRRPESAS